MQPTLHLRPFVSNDKITRNADDLALFPLCFPQIACPPARPVYTGRRVLVPAARDGLPEVRVGEEGLHRAAAGLPDQRHAAALVAALHRVLRPGLAQPGAGPVGHRQHPGGGVRHQPVHAAGHLRRR